MSHYGPASQKKSKSTNRTKICWLPQYDYNHHRKHKHVAMQRSEHLSRLNNRLRRNIRIVPWRDERELREIGMSLFLVLDVQKEILKEREDCEEGIPPTTTTAMCPEEAFAMISVWKSRMAALEGLPHAIESTAALAQVYWRDSQLRIKRQKRMKKSMSDSSSVSVTELRLAYSAAIVRCINGFADSLQQERVMAASVASLCGQLGIPSWLVDARHESSHNALPNVELLRLSASTLLEFMRNEYWIPRCTQWNNIDEQVLTTPIGIDKRIPTREKVRILKMKERNIDLERDKNDRYPIDFLLEYGACALDWDTDRGANADGNEREFNKQTLPKSKRKSKCKKEASLLPKKTIILPYDPLFGECGTLSSNDDDYSDTVDKSFHEESKVDKPIHDSIWGKSIGTNTNRYMLLHEPTKEKKNRKYKKQKKSIPIDPKKKKGEKSPTDCAKLFVRSILSLQEGYKIATQYLVWGDVDDVPIGRGVMIPGSEVDFPATPHGVTKCWQRYSPLLHVISRNWPGFAAYMMTNLIECALLNEDFTHVHANDTNQGSRQQELGQVSSRKLYFLSAWIRLLLSQRFVAALDRRLVVKKVPRTSNNPFEIPLARLSHLECLGYPLNCLLDRYRRFNNHCQKSNDRKSNKNTSNSIISDLNWTEPSRTIIRSLETVLGEKNTDNLGYPQRTVSLQDSRHNMKSGVSESSQESNYGDASKGESEVSSGPMSLDAMERLLLLNNNDSDQEESKSKLEPNIVGPEDILKELPNVPVKPFMDEIKTPFRRPAWVRCEHWDACAIGTLPGYST